jgi:hypothetical protein
MLFFIYLLLMILGVFFFFINKKEGSLIILLFFITNGFQLIPEAALESFPINKYIDYLLLYIILILFFMIVSNTEYFKHKDKFSSILVLLLIYMLYELISTIAKRDETAVNAIKVFRIHIFLGLYFIIRSIKMSILLKMMEIVFKITIVTAILYLLQIILHKQILSGTIDGFDSNFNNQIFRFRNVPLFLDFSLLYLLFFKTKIKFRSLLILLLLITLVAPMNRGPIIAFLAACSLFLLVTRKISKFFRYLIVGLIIGIAVWPLISYRFEKEDTGSDLTKAFSMNDYEDYESSENGSFSFRIALLLERMDYLYANPSKLITGIGLRHEDSPKTQTDFRFVVGAEKNNSSGIKVKQMIDTSDLVWATMIFRYGLLGVVLYLILFLYLLKAFYKDRRYSIAIVGFLLLSMYMINSFATDILIRPSTFFIFFIVSVVVQKLNRTENENTLKVNAINVKRFSNSYS